MSHPHHHAGDGLLPETFLALLVLCALLLLLVMGPAKAPSLDKLTEFVCDATPMLPSSRASRGTAGFSYYTCHSDHQTVHLGAIPSYTNPQKARDCRRSYGFFKIWRPAFPSSYGANIFQVTCNDAVISSYKDASASYETRRAFVATVAWALLALSGQALVRRSIRIVRQKRRDQLIED